MNILDKMQLLKLLREYRKGVISDTRLLEERVTRNGPICEVETQVENDIRNWLNSGGGF